MMGLDDDDEDVDDGPEVTPPSSDDSELELDTFLRLEGGL